MMRSFFISLLAIVLAAVPALSAYAMDSPMGNEIAISAMDDEHADRMDCENCLDCESDDADISGCGLMCQLACSAGAAMGLPMPFGSLTFYYRTHIYARAPDDRTAGVSPTYDLPPPRI